MRPAIRLIELAPGVVGRVLLVVVEAERTRGVRCAILARFAMFHALDAEWGGRAAVGNIKASEAKFVRRAATCMYTHRARKGHEICVCVCVCVCACVRVRARLGRRAWVCCELA